MQGDIASTRSRTSYRSGVEQRTQQALLAINVVDMVRCVHTCNISVDASLDPSEPNAV
jgi:hypothetical protein